MTRLKNNCSCKQTFGNCPISIGRAAKIGHFFSWCHRRLKVTPYPDILTETNAVTQADADAEAFADEVAGRGGGRAGGGGYRLHLQSIL
jgi:hypothetical protein